MRKRRVLRAFLSWMNGPGVTAESTRSLHVRAASHLRGSITHHKQEDAEQEFIDRLVHSASALGLDSLATVELLTVARELSSEGKREFLVRLEFLRQSLGPEDRVPGLRREARQSDFILQRALGQAPIPGYPRRRSEAEADDGTLTSDEEATVAAESVMSIDHALARLFLRLGPPPEPAALENSPTFGGDGGAQK